MVKEKTAGVRRQERPPARRETLALAGPPPLPDPVPVTLDARTTAYVVLDLVDPPCAARPSCLAMLPAAAALLKKARGAGCLVVYTLGRTPGLVVRPEVAPTKVDAIVHSSADKFFRTDLDEILRERRVETLLLAGMSANGAVLYTAFGATARGHTVAVAVDAICAEDPFALTVARYQLLHQPGFKNADNRPLRPGAVTLTRSHLVEFER